MTPSPTVRRTEIDGLRALAALWVVADHFALSQLVGMHYGFLAVRLMLILSAYFAARQLRLLWSEGPTPVDGSAKASKLVHYYTSRVVRLGIMAYGTILLAVMLDVDGARGTWRWHAAFATNEWIVRYGEWPGALSHFWTLAVQMQFLLLLPLIFLITGRRGLQLVLVAGVLAAVAHRACTLYGGVGDLVRWMPISNSLDAFCLGVGLAWVERERPALFARLQTTPVALAAVGCLVGVHWLRGNAYESLAGIFTETGEALALVLLFGALVGGRTFGPVGQLLRSWPLVRLGGASLSLYALHPIVERVLNRVVMHHEEWAWFASTPGYGLLAAALSVAAAVVGFRLVEIPSRKLAAWVEPGLTRFFTHLATRGERYAASFCWRLRYAGTVGLLAVIFFTATGPLRLMALPELDADTELVPIAEGEVHGEEVEPFTPTEPQYPFHIDDTEHLDVA